MNPAEIEQSAQLGRVGFSQGGMVLRMCLAALCEVKVALDDVSGRLLVVRVKSRTEAQRPLLSVEFVFDGDWVEFCVRDAVRSQLACIRKSFGLVAVHPLQTGVRCSFESHKF